MTPQYRTEAYLNAIRAALEGTSPLPPCPDAPVWRVERFLAAILSAAKGDDPATACPEPAWRQEEFLRAVYDRLVNADPAWPCPAPATRLETYLAAVCEKLETGNDVSWPSPVWNTERWLSDILYALSPEETYGPAAVVDFETAASKRIKSLLAGIQPVQSGSGTPSPDNVRPIAGRTGLSVFVSPTGEAGDASVHSVSWQEEAGAVYGGTVDVVTGTLTVRMICVDLGSLTWTQSGNDTVKQSYRTSSVRDRIRPVGVSETPNALCSVFGVTSRTSQVSTPDAHLNSIGITTTGLVEVVTPPSAYSTPADFKAAVSGVQFVCELAEPTVLQLTPQRIDALIGSNYIWSDGSDVTVTV